MEAYCLKCKKKVEIKEPKQEPKQRYSGTCPECGKGVSTFVKKSSAAPCECGTESETPRSDEVHQS